MFKIFVFFHCFICLSTISLTLLSKIFFQSEYQDNLHSRGRADFGGNRIVFFTYFFIFVFIFSSLFLSLKNVNSEEFVESREYNFESSFLDIADNNLLLEKTP